MDLEARSTQDPAKNMLNNSGSQWTREQAITAGVRAANEANNRSQLLAGAELDDSAPTSSSQRDRMAQATQQLDRTGNRIQDGKRTLLETEDLGVSILQDLHRQRDTISSAREHIHAADDTIGRSRKILQSMGRRRWRTKRCCTSSRSLRSIFSSPISSCSGRRTTAVGSDDVT